MLREQKNASIVSLIADVGAAHPLLPPILYVQPFKHFFTNSVLDTSRLDEKDGACTRRELITRFLLLNAVLDQGPDIDGVRELLTLVVNRLYENEVRIFHTPLDFFKEMHVSVEEIWNNHESVKKSRGEEWARINQSIPSKYNLFMDGSKQTLNYAVFRWGTPLALPYLLAQKCDEATRSTALLDYLESFESAETMSDQLKSHYMYGFGKAIGDKACHLFAKWVVSTFGLIRRTDDGWGKYSYEVPYDSNAGRVLWRTGYFLRLASKEAYKKKEVLQPKAGKGGKTYIRVTNIRGMRAEENAVSSEVREIYVNICVQNMKTHKNGPKKIEIQRLQHALLKRAGKSVAAFDDGLIHVGRQYCHNHAEPNCAECPLRSQCEGANGSPELIANYRT